MHKELRYFRDLGKLGVIIDNCLSLDAHISNICRSTHFHLRNIAVLPT